MTFSVSKLETQLGLWFASVLCHVLVYCTNRAEEWRCSPWLYCKRPCQLGPQGKAKPGLGRSLEKGDSGVQSCFLGWAGWGRVKASSPTSGKPRSGTSAQDVCSSKQVQKGYKTVVPIAIKPRNLLLCGATPTTTEPSGISCGSLGPPKERLILCWD